MQGEMGRDGPKREKNWSGSAASALPVDRLGALGAVGIFAY